MTFLQLVAACLASVILCMGTAAALAIVHPSSSDPLVFGYGVGASAVAVSFFLFRFAGVL